MTHFNWQERKFLEWLTAGHMQFSEPEIDPEDQEREMKLLDELGRENK